MHRSPIQFIIGIALLLLSTQASLEAITIGSLRDFPAGSIRYSMYEGKNRHFLEITWGGDTEDTGSSGPVVKLKQAGATKPKVVNISEGTLDRLFALLSKLAASYPIPRSTTSDRSNRDMFQLYIGLRSDPVRLAFPSNEPELWNRAAACWMQFAEIMKKEVSLGLPEATQLKGTSTAIPKAGLASIADYTSLKLSVERVHRSKANYGTISTQWSRSEDGAITFTAKYDGRTGDRISATPTSAQIRPLFNELQKLAKGYRYPSFANNKKNAVTRGYNSINVGIIATNQPGEFLLPYFSTDSSQWGGADRLWSLLLELFPKEEQGKIIQ